VQGRERAQFKTYLQKMNEPGIQITVQTESILKQNTKITNNTKHQEWILKIIETNGSCFILVFF
jgi:hypothetical protein